MKWYRPPEYYSQSRWRGTWALDGGGALMNQGIHTVDLLLWLLGDVRRVYAKAVTALHAIEVEDTAVAVLEFASGAVGRSRHDRGVAGLQPPGLDQRHARDRRHRAGSGRPVGSARAGARRRRRRRRAAAGGRRVGRRSRVVADASAHRRVFEDFVTALDSGRPPRVDGREGRRSVALAEAIYDSSRSGQPVDS